jgi:hypothetical protein
MYIIWQDAQWKSRLVRSGYNMTQLRAVFALATAAGWETGLGNAELVCADEKRLSDELFRCAKGRGGETVISEEIFGGAGERGLGSVEGELKKRNVRVREERI